MLQRLSIMKKMLSLFFTFLYLNTAFGVGIDVHFCGKGMADITIAGPGHGHCDCPPGSMPPGCCQHVVRYCKTDNHKIPVITAPLAVKDCIQVPALYPNYIDPLLGPGFFKKPGPDDNYYLSSPLLPVDLCVFHQVFRL